MYPTAAFTKILEPYCIGENFAILGGKNTFLLHFSPHESAQLRESEHFSLEK
jgi:hypothetical protein